MKKLITILFLLLNAGIYSQIIPTHKNVDYVGKGNAKQFMDLYVPTGATKAPAVIFIHGGAWTVGSKGKCMEYCDDLFNSGFVIVDINYRLIGDSIWPAQMYDCKAAVRFLKANAATYKIDTCKIGVMGTSAGGHLTEVLGTSNGVASMEDMSLGNKNVSSNVHAAFGMWGPTDFLLAAANPSPKCSLPFDPNDSTSSFSQLVGCAIQTCTATVQTANPITYVDPTDPPFEIAHGDSDCGVPSPMSQFLYNALIANGVDAKLTIYPGFAHGNDTVHWNNSNLKSNILNFFTAKLKNVNPCSGVGIAEENNITNMTIFPNPFSSSATISFSLTKEDNVSIKLYDLLGNEVQKITEGNLQSGKHTIEINSNGLVNGIYLCHIQSETIGAFRKIEIMK